ncbi:protein mono-ADP-ribosyltransferase PARP16-like isoform X2 [Watersipora subatra]|uniref:protein mono-ADP-ribosyltransferase PARP16-like isoform X2 n=1 Tax=Watersipora subatra TaxID=2589382 RepID=UPI00355BA9AB
MEAPELQGISYMRENAADVDFAVSIFAAAVSSYKYESLLKPFPPMYCLINGEKDICNLRSDIAALPSITAILNGSCSLSTPQMKLIEWVIKSHKTKIRSAPLDQMSDLRKLTGEQISLPDPEYLYELEYDESKEAAFQETRAARNLIYAYHGSKAENFYSILHHGLHAHVNKTSLYGEGTYLALEPTVAMGYSKPSSTGWPESTLGKSFSIIALCEVIEHPSVIHKSSREGRRAPNSYGGDVPDKYLIVTNNDMVRLKYLLVYSGQRSTGIRCRKEPSQCLLWIQRHSQALLLLFYASILFCIALVGSSKFWARLQQLYVQTFDNHGWADPL